MVLWGFRVEGSGLGAQGLHGVACVSESPDREIEREREREHNRTISSLGLRVC